MMKAYTAPLKNWSPVTLLGILVHRPNQRIHCQWLCSASSEEAREAGMEEEIEERMGPGRVCKWWFGQETTQDQLRGFHSLPCSLVCAIVRKWSLLPPHSVWCQCCEKKSKDHLPHPSVRMVARQHLQGEVRLQRNQIMVHVPQWVKHPEQMVQWQHQASKNSQNGYVLMPKWWNYSGILVKRVLQSVHSNWLASF